MTERNTTSHLRLANEHLICGCQAHKGPSIWNIIELKAGGHYAKEGMELPTLVFLLVGDMTVSTASAVGQAVSGGQMFLVSASDNFYAQATTDAQVLCCSFDRDISQCNRFSFDQLQRFMLPRHAAARGGEKNSRCCPSTTCCCASSKRLASRCRRACRATTIFASRKTFCLFCCVASTTKSNWLRCSPPCFRATTTISRRK